MTAFAEPAYLRYIIEDMFLLFNLFSFDKDDDIAVKVRKAAENEDAFAALSKEFERHNRFTASQSTGRFITESDDEWSVVLLAFYEAVRSYRPDKGSFTSFSDMVIKRRLIDHARAEKRTAREIAVDMDPREGRSDDMRQDPAADQMAAQALASEEREREAQNIRWEIEGLNKALAKHGIAFSDLPDASPKAEKTRIACAKAVTAICDSRELCSQLKKSGRLPAKEISGISGIPLKTLDKHRKYIIAAVEIMTGDYTQLQAYTAGIRRMAESDGKRK